MDIRSKQPRAQGEQIARRPVLEFTILAKSLGHCKITCLHSRYTSFIMRFHIEFENVEQIINGKLVDRCLSLILSPK